MTKRLRDLTASDVPDVDGAKFEEWKTMYRTFVARAQVAPLLIVFGVLAQFLVGGIIAGLMARGTDRGSAFGLEAPGQIDPYWP